MPHIYDNSADIPAINFTEQGSKPSQPDTGEWKLYFKSSGAYIEDDAGTETALSLGAAHAAVTLSSDAGSNLLSLSTQEIGIDNQNANVLFAGPASGAAAAPAFRAAVPLDLATDPDEGEILTVASGALAWAAPSAVVDAIAATLIDAEGDLIIGTADNTPGRLAVGTAGYALVSRSSRPAYEAQYSTLNFVIDGGGAEIADGVKGDIVVDFACTLVAWTLLADQSGAIKIDVWVDSYANFPPTNDDSICNGHEPEIAASAAKAQDTDIADWSGEAITAGSVMRFNVDSCTTITRATLALKVLRS